MEIKVPDSWLREYLDTNATDTEMAKALSLSGPTIDKIDKTNSDIIYTIEITPNRGDLLSIIGLAREANAILPSHGFKSALINLPEFEGYPKKNTKEELPLKISLENDSLCPFLLSCVITDLEIKPSPNFIAERLIKSGMRSINNLVDISNYIMLETGQPLHLFDYNKVKGASMNLRLSQKNETLTTLDGETRKLGEGVIVIEDSERLIDLCGIMGGENTEITHDTKTAIVFMQIYDPQIIGKTFRKLNLVTEASLRFEKGLDYNMIDIAYTKTLELLKKHAGAKIASNTIKLDTLDKQEKEVEVNISLIEEYLGKRVTTEKMQTILANLGFEVAIIGGLFKEPRLRCRVPSYRALDIVYPEDLVEEVARIYGYANLKTTLPATPQTFNIKDDTYYFESKMKDVLVGLGFFETYNYSFVSGETIEKVNFPLKTVKLINPLSKDLAYLRPTAFCSLLPLLMEHKKTEENINLFEMERVNFGSGELVEEFRLTGVASAKSRQVAFYGAKFVVENILKELNITNFSFAPVTTSDFWDTGASSALVLGNETVGTFGCLKSSVGEAFNITTPIGALELSTDKVIKFASRLHHFSPSPDHPPVIEDISVVCSTDTEVAIIKGLIEKTIRDHSKLTLSLVEITDIFEDQSFGENNKSVTLRINYQREGKQVGGNEVTLIRNLIISEIEKEYKVRK